jgi:predicted porin
LYGKANVSYTSTDVEVGDIKETTLVLDSNASRIGIKGAEKVNDTLEAIYQAEFEVAIDDGDTSDGRVFSQRNIYIGIKGDFGSVIAGHFDTPFKESQNKIDLFNDLYGDIKNIVTINDNRVSNSIMYISPEVGGFTLYGDLIASEVDEVSNGTSIAATYYAGGFYGALAYDLNVEEDDTSAVRAVVQYAIKSWQFGLLAEEFEGASQEKYSGVVASIQYTINDWAIKGQYGQSDIKEEDGKTLSIGADYKLSKNAKLFGFFTDNQFPVILDNGDGTTSEVNDSGEYLGLGVEVKF